MNYIEQQNHEIKQAKKEEKKYIKMIICEITNRENESVTKIIDRINNSNIDPCVTETALKKCVKLNLITKENFSYSQR